MERPKAKMRLSELTHRLDSVFSTSLFIKAKKSYQWLRYLRFILLNFLYLAIIVGLFFCSIRLVVEPLFPGRLSRIMAPLLTKQDQQRQSKGKGKIIRHKKNQR